MRIIRYINGKKVEEPFKDNIVIENTEIASVISRVNRRLNLEKSRRSKDE